VWIVVILLGIVCLYCGFYDYSIVDATVNVTEWYWIYACIIGGFVAVFAVIEALNLRRHHVELLEYRALEADKQSIAALK
jgi:hypothetical protein